MKYEAMIAGLKRAIGVDQRIMPFGRSFSISATVAEGASTNMLLWQDPCSYYSSLNLGASNTAQLTPDGSVTANNIKEELKSYALLIREFNYDANKASQINQDIKMWDPTFDATEGGDVTIDAGTQRRNTQFLEGLQTIRDSGFLLTNTTVLGIPVSAPAAGEGALTVTLKLMKVVPIPYALLIQSAYMDKGVDIAALGRNGG